MVLVVPLLLYPSIQESMSKLLRGYCLFRVVLWIGEKLPEMISKPLADQGLKAQHTVNSYYRSYCPKLPVVGKVGLIITTRHYLLKLVNEYLRNQPAEWRAQTTITWLALNLE